jgi:Leucine-rich repeat (LRR) protein
MFHKRKPMGLRFRILVVSSLLLGACQVSLEPSIEEMERWRLPQDFPKNMQGLRELTLPSGVDRVDWLPRDLEFLDAGGTQLTSTRDLPPSLRTLSLRQAPIVTLVHLPPRLESLDISWTNISRVSGLPPTLQALVLGGDQITSVSGLPSGLRDLVLLDTQVSDLNGLPAGLRSLSIKASNAESLALLPRTVRMLSLQGTLISNLQGAPAELSLLETLDNRKLRIVSYPKYLVHYSSSGRLRKELSALAYLERLEIASLSKETISFLPSSLVSLKVVFLQPDVDLSQLPRRVTAITLPGCAEGNVRKIPEGVKELTLNMCDLRQLPDLPPSLESLDISGTEIRDLSKLPAGLKRLRLGYWKMESIPDLPRSLEVLSVAGAPVLKSLGSLPETLFELDVSDTSLSVLPALPPSLKRLDISGAKRLRLSSLKNMPARLESLTLSPGQIMTWAEKPSSLRAIHFRETL